MTDTTVITMRPGNCSKEDYDQFKDINAGRIKFQGINEKDYFFVKFVQPDRILCWRIIDKHHEICEGIKVTEVNQKNLEELKVWERLSDTIKAEVVKIEQDKSKCGRPRAKRTKVDMSVIAIDKPENIDDKAVVESSEPAKPIDMKNKIVCCVCKSIKGTNPPQLAKQIEKSGLSKEEYLLTYRCRSCRK